MGHFLLQFAGAILQQFLLFLLAIEIYNMLKHFNTN
jgi:hypothetical protein